MTATEKALAAMAKSEEAWNKMVNERVQVSEEFVKECKAFQKEQREWYLEKKGSKSAK